MIWNQHLLKWIQHNVIVIVTAWYNWQDLFSCIKWCNIDAIIDFAKWKSFYETLKYLQDQSVSGHVKQPYRNFKLNNKQLLVSDDNCFVNSLNFQNAKFKEYYTLTPTLFKAIYYCLVKQSTNYSMLFFSHNHKHIIFFLQLTTKY